MKKTTSEIADHVRAELAAGGEFIGPGYAPPEIQLFDREEAATYIGLQPQTLAAWASSGRYDLTYIRVGRKAMYRRADLDAFLSRRSATTTAAD